MVRVGQIGVGMIRVAALSLVVAVVSAQTASGQENYTTLHTFNGDRISEAYGWSVSGAGDVNGDGYADVIVGAPLNDKNARGSGSAQVLSGKDGVTLYSFEGRSPYERLGDAVSGAGDVNGDGYADVIVGAPFDMGYPDANSVKAWVFSGRDGGALLTFKGEDTGLDQFGKAVSGAGDVNRDGYADVIIGAPFGRKTANTVGSATVFSGKDGGALFTFTGDSDAHEFGHSVSGAGDVNGDGYADVIVGAPWDLNGGLKGGKAWVFSGKDGGVLFTFNGDSAGAIFGWSVSGAGDVNGDGYADVIVGAPYDDNNGLDSGRSRVFSGKDGGVLFTFNGDSAGDLLGWSVSGAGDVNRDGYADVIVGAPYDDNNGLDSGSARVFSGKDGAIIYTVNGQDQYKGPNQFVSGGGDVNGDGYADVIVGAPFGDPFGSARVFSDLCPNDNNKGAPGQCGCGVPDTDSDGDGIVDCVEQDPPTDISLSAASLPENAAPDTVVGTLTTTDPNPGDTFTYTLVSGAGSTDNASFNISTDKLRATSSFDFETKSTYSVRIRSTDKDGLFTEKAFTINVTDVDDGITVTGTTANDSFVATYQGDGATHRWLVTRGGTTVFNGVVASAIGLVIDGLAGADSLQVVGRTTDDRLALGTAKVLVNGAAVTFPAIETLRLTANSGNDALTIVEGLPVGVSTSFDGGAGTDRLEVTAGANTWSVTGSGIGNLNSVFPFTAVESLVGGTEADQFVFAAAGSVAGRVIGGAGVDTLNLSAKNTTITVNLQTNTATSTGGIESIETILGGNATADLLIAPNTPNTWQIDGLNAGTVNSQVTFSGFENLTGGTAADTFVVGARGGVTRVINGGTGVDLLDLRAKSGATEIRLGTTPSIAGVVGGYAAVEQVLGNGSEGSKIVGTSANTAWTANAAGDVSVGAVRYRGFKVVEAGVGSDTLTAQDLSYWIFTGRDSGLLWIVGWDTGAEAPTIVFSGIENAVGSLYSDAFYFFKSGALTGTINAGDNIENIDYIVFPEGGISWGSRVANFDPPTEPTEVRLGAVPSITGVVGGFVGIEEVTARPGALGNKLVGSNTATTWQVVNAGQAFLVGGVLYYLFNRIEAGTAGDTLKEGTMTSCSMFAVNEVNGGRIECSGVTASFSGIENLVALSGGRFVFGALGELTGSLSGGPSFGGDQTFTIDFSAKTGSFDVSLGNNGGRGIPGVVANFTSVDKVIGNIRSIDKLR